jgi:hypothetical protein
MALQVATLPLMAHIVAMLSHVNSRNHGWTNHYAHCVATGLINELKYHFNNAENVRYVITLFSKWSPTNGNKH